MHKGHSGCSGSKHVLSTASWLHPDCGMRRGVRLPTEKEQQGSPASSTTTTTASASSAQRLKGGKVKFNEEEFVPVAKYEKDMRHQTKMADEQRAKAQRIEATNRQRSNRSYGGYNNGGGGGYDGGGGGHQGGNQGHYNQGNHRQNGH